MEFLDRIRHFSGETALDKYAALYGCEQPTVRTAMHIVFHPMPAEMAVHLEESYKQPFPQELLALYRHMNGAELFRTLLPIGNTGITVPFSCFSVYGVPWDTDRKHVYPFNLSIEDLNRVPGTPHGWLKFGAFSMPDDLNFRMDLFFDPENRNVHSIVHNAPSFQILETWQTLDICLCSIFDRLMLIFNPKL